MESKETDKSKLKGSELAQIVRGFTARVNAIRQFAIHIGPVADATDEGKARQQAEEILRALGVDTSSDSPKAFHNLAIAQDPASDKDTGVGTRRVSITDPATIRRLSNVLSDFRRTASSHGPILRQSTLVMAVSQLDALMASLLRAYFRKFPGSLDGDDSLLSFKELCELQSIETAREVVMTKRIESVLFRSLRDQLEYFTKILKVDIAFLKEYLHILDETIQRRHILVHNNGAVSKLYLTRVDPSLVASYKAIEGKPLPVDQEYLRRAIDRVNLAGVVIGQQCWRKWDPSEAAIADDALNENIFDTLHESRYTAAQYLGQFGVKVCKSSDATRRNLVLNLAQAYKWAGKQSRAKEVVESEDWTSCSLRYQLGASLMRNDMESAYKLLPLAIKAEELSIEILDSWPIFREFRKEARVRSAFATSGGYSESSPDS